MRYLRIFLLHFQQVFEARSRAIVWFLVALANPLILLLFWQGAHFTSQTIKLTTITTYYLLQIILGSVLMAHIEDEISVYDIQEGNLVAYLLRPFSYLLAKLYNEFPYRLFQGILGIVAVGILLFFFSRLFTFHVTLIQIIFALLISFLGYTISFLYKVILGILTIWFMDIQGLYQLSEMLIFIFAGYILPIYLFPSWLQTISYVLPFSYMVYFPIVGFEGLLTFTNSLEVLVGQVVWVVILWFAYARIWKEAVKKFSAVGQ